MNHKTLKEEIRQYLEAGEDRFLPQLSLDCAIFGFNNRQLKVLLLQPYLTNLWTLPGGFIGKHENLDEAALRVLKERTNLDNIFLSQFYTFGQVSRNLPHQIGQFIAELGLDPKKYPWIQKRFVTTGYYALVNYNEVFPQTDLFSKSLCWADVRDLPEMAMDHEHIIHKALEMLQKGLYNKPITYNLLSETFTMPELQSLYESILDRAIDRGNFRKKMLKANILERLEKKKTGEAHRAPYLYRFDQEVYEKSLEEGQKIGF